MINRKLLASAVAFGAIALAPGSAFAALTDSFSLLTTELNNQPLRVDKFNDQGGTLILTGVTITLTSSLHNGGAPIVGGVVPDGTVTNNAAGPETFTVSFRAQSFTANAVGIAGLGQQTLWAPFDLISQQTFNNLGAGASAAYTATDTNSPSNPVVVNPALAGFVGAGQFGYDLNTQILQSITGGGGNIALDINTYASATLTVAYTSRPAGGGSAPIPTSVALMGLGLVALGSKARGKKKQALIA